MIVVSNTSPVMNLAVVKQLAILHQLYGEVLIPQAVYDEIVVLGAGQPGAAEIAQTDWITVKAATNRTLVTALQLELDLGEAEAIALALELEADLLLIDERKGRQVAGRLGCKLIGLLGALVQAKQKNLVTAVRPILDDLNSMAGFRISQALYRRVLETVGE